MYKNPSFEVIVLSALRYALLRSSYAPGMIAEFITKEWQNFSIILKKGIQKEIAQHFAVFPLIPTPWNKIMFLKIDDKKDATA